MLRLLAQLTFCVASSASLFNTQVLAQDKEVRRASLSDDFQSALSHDPEWLSAVAMRDAGIEAYPQARAALLPQVGFNAQRSQNNTDSSTQTSLGPLNRSFDNYPASSATIQARQALIRPKSWAALAQGKAQIRYAEQSLEAAKQDLALKLVSMHAELFSAKQTIESVTEQLKIQEKLSESANRQFLGGDIGRVDLELSLAKEQQLKSQLTQVRLEFENLVLARKELTGVGDPFEALPLNSDSVFKLTLGPDNATENWIALALRENPSILAQIAAIEVSKEEVRKANFDHFPTADLYASRSASKSAMDNTIGTEFRTTQVGVQLSIPIYAGGAVESTIRQAQAGLRRTEQQLESIKAKIRLQIERDFRTLAVSREEVLAQQQSLKALNIALTAAIKGRQAGVSVLADELMINMQIAGVRRNIARSNANALIAYARLMAVTNRLQQEQLVEVERLVISARR